ncbi:hypothetical protein DPEC_G00281010 [Dallia pectoralis]|uniref:Uncharacterized protein n=1 Tax=Dallia pectoralis TaxID=75939 RepID=A0ACC2FMI7_DALPE|nr:hypothetical protein DPEC_G00281010 [Dallia pectoralis]
MGTQQIAIFDDRQVGAMKSLTSSFIFFHHLFSEEVNSLLPIFPPVVFTQTPGQPSDPSEDIENVSCFANLHLARISDGTSKQQDKRKILKKVKSCLSIEHEDYKDNSEQDAHEFVLHLICRLKEEGLALKGSPEPYIYPVEQLEFMLNTTRTCTRVLMLHVKRFCAIDRELIKIEELMSIPQELSLCEETVQLGCR